MTSFAASRSIKQELMVFGNSYEIRIQRTPESCAFAVGGANYEISGRQAAAEGWDSLARIHHDDPMNITQENTKVLSERFGYAFFHDTIVVTSDAGKSWDIWNSKKDLPDWKASGAQFVNWATIGKVDAFSDGKVQIHLARTRREGAITQALSNDYGKTWSYFRDEEMHREVK